MFVNSIPPYSFHPGNIKVFKVNHSFEKEAFLLPEPILDGVHGLHIVPARRKSPFLDTQPNPATECFFDTCLG